jgi:hypothetical protein
MQHWQEAEVAVAEERERAVVEIEAQAARLSLPRQVPWSPWDPGHCQGRRSRWWVAYPHQDQLCRVGRGDEDTAPGAAHVVSSLVRRCRLL